VVQFELALAKLMHDNADNNVGPNKND